MAWRCPRRLGSSGRRCTIGWATGSVGGPRRNRAAAAGRASGAVFALTQRPGRIAPPSRGGLDAQPPPGAPIAEAACAGLALAGHGPRSEPSARRSRKPSGAILARLRPTVALRSRGCIVLTTPRWRAARGEFPPCDPRRADDHRRIGALLGMASIGAASDVDSALNVPPARTNHARFPGSRSGPLDGQGRRCAEAAEFVGGSDAVTKHAGN
jgi:hypothetical protein